MYDIYFLFVPRPGPEQADDISDMKKAPKGFWLDHVAFIDSQALPCLPDWSKRLQPVPRLHRLR